MYRQLLENPLKVFKGPQIQFWEPQGYETKQEGEKSLILYFYMLLP